MVKLISTCGIIVVFLVITGESLLKCLHAISGVFFFSEPWRVFHEFRSISHIQFSTYVYLFVQVCLHNLTSSVGLRFGYAGSKFLISADTTASSGAQCWTESALLQDALAAQRGGVYPHLPPRRNLASRTIFIFSEFPFHTFSLFLEFSRFSCGNHVLCAKDCAQHCKFHFEMSIQTSCTSDLSHSSCSIGRCVAQRHSKSLMIRIVVA